MDTISLALSVTSRAHFYFFPFLFSELKFPNCQTAWAPIENNATIYLATDPNVDLTNPNFTSILGCDQQEVFTPFDEQFGIESVVNSLDDASHGFHMHGHDMAVYGWGDGLYGEGETTWNYDNPVRRDTINIPANSHVVLRWCNNYPGIRSANKSILVAF